MMTQRERQQQAEKHPPIEKEQATSWPANRSDGNPVPIYYEPDLTVPIPIFEPACILIHAYDNNLENG